MKYGFFLGSFDPPHLGHFAVVEKVLKEGLVDRVIMVPAPQNPWKKEKPASLGIRYWMCVDGIKELGLDKCMEYFNPNCKEVLRNGKVEKVEGVKYYKGATVMTGTNALWDETPLMERSQGGVMVSYSYRQLQAILNQFPKKIEFEKYLICGTDVVDKVKEWKNGEWILDNFKLLHVARPGYEESDLPEMSSSDVRSIIKQGIEVTTFLPDSVWQRIKDFKLYGYGE